MKRKALHLISILPSFFRRHKLVIPLLYSLPGTSIQLVEFNGKAKLFADLKDPFPREYFLRKSFDPEFFSITSPFLDEGGVFFDVGANWGFCSFGLMNYLKNKSVEYHLFEANSNIFRTLLKSAKLNSENAIHINNCCVTNEVGTSKLKISKTQSGSSFISEVGDQEVENLILDRYINSKDIKKINFLKIDIEGWEPLALKGAEKSIKNGIVDVIYTEFVSSHLLRSGYDVKQYGALLQELGFHLFYCRNSELKSSFLEQGKLFELNINNHILKLGCLDLNNLPVDIYMGVRNILAIHRSSKYLGDALGF